MENTLVKSAEISASTAYGKLLRGASRQSSVIFAGKAAAYGLGMLSLVLMARILGPALLGRYQLGLVIVQVGSVLCTLGFGNGLVRFISPFEIEGGEKIPSLLLFSLGTTVLASVALSATLYFLSSYIAHHYFHSAEMTDVIKLFCLYLPVFALFRVGSSAVTGAKRPDLESNIENIAAPSAFIVLLLAVALLGGGLFGCIAVRVLSHVIAIACIFWFLVRRYGRFFRRWSRSFELKKYLSFTFPMMLIGLVYLLLGRMDVIMLGYFVEDRAVGIYTVAVRLAMFIVVGLEIMVPVVGPNFADLGTRKDMPTIAALLSSSTKGAFYVGLVIFSIIAVLGTDILRIFGREFAGGAFVLLILAAGQLVNSLTGPVGQLLIMTGKHAWEVANSLVMVGLCFILNLILIPRMGIVGAAVATSISTAGVNLVKLIEVKFLYSFHPYGVKYLKGILAVSVGALACYLLRNLTVSAGIGPLWRVLFGSTALTGCSFLVLYCLGLDPEDRVFLNTLLRRKIV